MAMGQATGQPAGLQGTGYKQVSTYTPEQTQLFQRLFGMIGPDSNTAKLAGGDQSQFEQLEAPALKQFNQLQGNLASRFSGMGSGARHSSGFQNAANQATQDFAGQLQSRRMDISRQAMQDLRGMAGELLGAQPNSLIPEQKPWWQEALIGLGGAAGTAAGTAGSLYAGKKLGLL